MIIQSKSNPLNFNDCWLEKESEIVNLVDKITAKQINPNVPEFRVGYTVVVGCKIIETKGGKEKDGDTFIYFPFSVVHASL